MRIGLAVPLVTRCVEDNLKRVAAMTERVSLQGAELVLFPEAVLTGLSNCDLPEKDLPLCVAIPGDETEKIASLARNNHIFLAIGLLEKDDGRIYDCALLFSPEGVILMKYRRMQAQWHGQQADPRVYCEGACVSKVETECGVFSFLICGDLFDDSILSMVRSIGPEYVLVPMSRCFEDGAYDQKRWDSVEKAVYARQVEKLRVVTFMTNSLEDPSLGGGSFGGAFVFDSKGNEMKSYPLGKTGILLVDV